MIIMMPERQAAAGTTTQVKSTEARLETTGLGMMGDDWSVERIYSV